VYFTLYGRLKIKINHIESALPDATAKPARHAAFVLGPTTRPYGGFLG